MNIDVPLVDLALFIITFGIYVFLAIRLTKSAIKYFKAIPPLDMRIAFIIAVFDWWWFSFVYALLLARIIFNFELPITDENFRNLLRPFSIALLGSMAYLIYRIFP